MEENEIVNLVFAGGGSKGGAISGAMDVVEEQVTRKMIKRCAGTSVGSIYAALYSFGMRNADIKSIMQEKQLSDFISGLSEHAQKKVIKSADKGSQGRSFFALKTVKGAKGELKTNLKKDLGISDGSAITTWINRLGYNYTKKVNITFGEMAALHNKNSEKYKLLYVIGTNLSTGRVTVFSHETVPDMMIANAVRISTACPYVFQPECIWRKQHDGSILKDEKGHQFWDGGLVWNCPLTLFDEKRFIDGNSENDHDPIINPQTLAIRYVSQAIKDYYSFGADIPVQRIESPIDLAKSVMKATFIGQESALDTPENRNRIIAVDDLGISTFEANLRNQKLSALIDSGKVASNLHFDLISTEEAENKIQSLREAVKILKEDDRSECLIL